MGQARSFIHKSNPFRPDTTWPVVLIQGMLALGIGLYALLAENSARHIIVLLNGLHLAWEGLTDRGDGGDGMDRYRLLRAGIGIATGLIVVADHFRDFIGLDALRVVAGIGLIGIGVITLIGTVATREELGWRIAALASAVLLAAWGVVVLYQASNDSRASEFIGWSAIAIGVAMIAIAGYRRQRSLGAPARS
ncbi:MAG: hypothetical protein M3457_16630 [Chloroflexota bacterium]|nr:hypothetical protein [Chloroflexota bacterium]